MKLNLVYSCYDYKTGYTMHYKTLQEITLVLLKYKYNYALYYQSFLKFI